jgi:hypothetical protein
MGRERNEGGWYLRFKLRRIEIRSQRCPFPIRLAESRRGPITELYVFRGTAGKAEMITEDKKRQEIAASFIRRMGLLNRHSCRTRDVPCRRRRLRQVLPNVAKDGYHHWPELWVHLAVGKVTTALRPPRTDLPSAKVPPWSSANSRVIGRPKPYPGALSSMRWPGFMTSTVC